ncbi:MAG: tyrosine-type recombinase/integrase [Gammaproteobacteria bacterium]
MQRTAKLYQEYDYIFASSHKPQTQPISNNAMLYGLYRLGYHGIKTVHGFRHLASTSLRELGYPSHLVEKQLSHENKNKIEATYNKAEYLPDRIKMMQFWADL